MSRRSRSARVLVGEVVYGPETMWWHAANCKDPAVDCDLHTDEDCVMVPGDCDGPY